MAIHETLLVFSLLLTLALLCEPLARRLHLPLPALLVLAGFIGSEVMVGMGMDTGIRFDDFHDLIVYAFLPLLVFAGALTLDTQSLRRQLGLILFLAVPLLTMSIGISAAVIYYGINHPEGFPWVAALLTGALLAATDPMAIGSLLETRGAPRRLRVLLDGESLFSDTAAIAVFALFLGLALNTGSITEPGVVALDFVRIFIGGFALGALFGGVFLLIIRWLSEPHQQLLASLVCAYSSYLAAQVWFEASGVMAVLSAGLILGTQLKDNGSSKAETPLGQAWRMMAYAVSALVFLLVGVTITLAMFEERWLAMLIGIGGVLAARAAGVYMGLPLIGLLPGVQQLPLAQANLVFWGGIRGAVTLALALSLPLELEYWWTIQSIAFGVVIFGLFIQAPSLPLLIRRPSE